MIDLHILQHYFCLTYLQVAVTVTFTQGSNKGVISSRVRWNAHQNCPTFATQSDNIRDQRALDFHPWYVMHFSNSLQVKRKLINKLYFSGMIPCSVCRLSINNCQFYLHVTKHLLRFCNLHCSLPSNFYYCIFNNPLFR